jgi:hypothetical protein
MKLKWILLLFILFANLICWNLQEIKNKDFYLEMKIVGKKYIIFFILKGSEVL